MLLFLLDKFIHKSIDSITDEVERCSRFRREVDHTTILTSCETTGTTKVIAVKIEPLLTLLRQRHGELPQALAGYVWADLPITGYINENFNWGLVYWMTYYSTFSVRLV